MCIRDRVERVLAEGRLPVVNFAAGGISTPADAAGLLRTAIRDDNPVCFFEHKVLYATKGEVPDDPDFCIPFGTADIKREGTDVTSVANLLYVKRALEAADERAKEGILSLIHISSCAYCTAPIASVAPDFPWHR